MIVTDVTKFHKHHLGSQGMLECGFIQGFGWGSIVHNN